LAPRVIDLLLPIPRTSELVFGNSAGRPFNDFSRFKRELDNLSEVKDWVLHDLRRTMVSGMARSGVMPHIADKILNHQSGTISGVAAVYQRHEFMAERQSALAEWARHVESLAPPHDQRSAA